MDVSVPTGEDRELSMLDAAQVNTLNAVERMGATLSLLGILLIFLTFALFKRLRTIPNTFIFFASIANIGACVACLIAYDGISALRGGQAVHAPLCQAQAFFFEWFMQSDPWWSFAMAINVYMVFFMSFNPAKFRQYLWLYCLICYGLPAIPAFAFLFIHPGDGHPIYGDAVLWCWIASEWNALRIYSYYLPIWVCSVLSAVIYFAVGYHVFHQRNQLRNLSLSNQGKDQQHTIVSDARDSAEKVKNNNNPAYYGTVTTEVQVTSAAAMPPPSAPPALPLLPAYTNPFLEQQQQPALRITTSVETQDPLSCSSSTIAPPPLAATVHTTHHHHHYPWSSSTPTAKDTWHHHQPDSPTTTTDPFSATNYTSISAGSTSPHKSTASCDDRGPSPTRLLSKHSNTSSQHQQQAPLPPAQAPHHQQQQHASTHKQQQNINIFRRMSSSTRRFGARLKHMDPVKLAYLRTSFVFAISILVTWTPSSINRVYTLIYPAQASYGLNMAAAVVLPLQGVWNAVIYFTTSWRIFREEMDASTGGRRVLGWIGLDERARRQRRGGGSFALGGGGGGGGGGAGGGTPRSEMGRSRRLEDERSRGDEEEGEAMQGDAVELQSPKSSPVLGRRPQPVRTNTMRVTSKGLDDFH